MVRRKLPCTVRFARIAAIMVPFLLVVAAFAGVPLYVQPRVDQLRHADAIFILGGYGQERYTVGIDLGQQGWAPNVVVSNPGVTPWISRWCRNPYVGGIGKPSPGVLRFAKWCPDSSPPTTRGEAETMRRLADEQNWKSIIVVTSRSHVTRTRLLFSRCFSDNFIVVASYPNMTIPRWIMEYCYQTLALIKASFQRGC